MADSPYILDTVTSDGDGNAGYCLRLRAGHALQLLFPSSSSSKDARSPRPAPRLISASSTSASTSASSLPVHALLGVLPLARGAAALVVVTACRWVAAACADNAACPIYAATKIDFLLMPSASRAGDGDDNDNGNDNDTRAKAKAKALNAALIAAAKSLLLADGREAIYFSPSYDLCASRQRNVTRADATTATATATSSPLLHRNLFDWTRHMMRDVIDLMPASRPFCCNVICGYARTVTLTTADSLRIDYTLISRKATRRAGVRYHARGVDDDGYVANFAETEQIVSIYTSSTTTDTTPIAAATFSHVQIRGSIPLFWGQPVSGMYTPPLEIVHKKSTESACAKHMAALAAVYGGTTTVLNLVNSTGYEAPLSQAFEKMAKLASPSSSGSGVVDFHSFDFHRECKKPGKYDNVATLISRLSPTHLGSKNYFCEEKKSSQCGIVRTNCIDCLDRTNVVQAYFARRILVEQLNCFFADSQNRSVAENQLITTESNFLLNNVWADNADAMSRLYAGTPALKTEYTRTGKRTWRGALDDLCHSIKRYLRNQYADGLRNDVLNVMHGHLDADAILLSGTHAGVGGDRSPERVSRARMYASGLAATYVGCVATAYAASKGGFCSVSFARYLLLINIIAASAAYALLYNFGRALVNLPTPVVSAKSK